MPNKNPLLAKSQKSEPESKQNGAPNLTIRFVSLIDKRQIEGIDVITDILTKKDFSVDHFEYKVTKKTETRRPINPKFPDGPSERVVLEERINVNANLKTIRQLEWRVVKDPENVLLINLTRTKGEAFCLPLVFPSIFEKEHQILVTGLNEPVRLQLITKPDLQFKSVPKIVTENADYEEQLLQRANRAKGMQATARELMDFPGIPEEMAKKLSQIGTGKKETLTPAQSINLIILSDLVTRYLPVLQTFQNDIMMKSGTVTQLSKQFAELTDGIRTPDMIKKLKDYLGDEGSKAENNAQIFSHLFQRLQQMKDGKLFVKGALLDVKHLFSLLRSLICFNRSQQDPDVWEKCLFFQKPFDAPGLIRKNMAAVYMMALASQKKILLSHAASNRSLMETYTVHNVQEFVIDKKAFISEDNLTDQEYGIIKSAVFHRLGLKAVKASKRKNRPDLFADPNFGPAKLYNPIHCVASSYGYLLDGILKKNLKRFLDEDQKTLLSRMDKNLFDVFYEKAVLEEGLPISRVVFGKWLESQTPINKIDKRGFINSELESNYDASLTPQILAGNGQSIFELDYTPQSFAKDYLEKRIQFFGVLDKLQKMGGSQKNPTNPARIFVDYLNQGEYSFHSHRFRSFIKNTFLYHELSRIVTEACSAVDEKLDLIAVKDKVILKLPLKYESILCIGNTFVYESDPEPKKVRLQVIPVKSIPEKMRVTNEFATKFEEVLQQAETPEAKGLIQALRILGEYQKSANEFFKFLTLTTLDRQINLELKTLADKNSDPTLLKYGKSDAKKLVVGNMRNVNLSSILQYDQEKRRNSKDPVDNQTFAQMLEGILFWKSVKKDLEKRTENVSNVVKMLGRFSKTLKEGSEWKSFYKMSVRFHQLVSQPIVKFSDNVIEAMTDLSGKMSRMVAKREYKDNAIAILFAEWKRKYPGKVKEVYFYAPFVEDDSDSGSNVLQRLRSAARLARLLKTKESLIFLLEATKQVQFKQMNEISRFLRQANYNLNFYVETSTLDDDKIGELSKSMIPNLFFQSGNLTPQKPEKAG